MRINNLQVVKCDLEENLSSSLKAQVLENQTKTLIISFTQLQQKFKSKPPRISVVKVRALLGEEQDPVTWDWDVWEDPIVTENFEPSDAQGSKFLYPQPYHLKC